MATSSFSAYYSGSLYSWRGQRSHRLLRASLRQNILSIGIASTYFVLVPALLRLRVLNLGRLVVRQVI
jgi:hypothetical protein